MLPDSPFAESGPLKVATEFFYSRGRTDVIAMNTDNEVIAFEAKLNKWRDALDQAYRNRCYAHYSYILLPEDTAHKAIKHNEEFDLRSVGICYISDGKVIVAQEATRTEPLQNWLFARAVEAIESEDICLRGMT